MWVVYVCVSTCECVCVRAYSHSCIGACVCVCVRARCVRRVYVVKYIMCARTLLY